MNSTLKNIIIFTLGGAVGATGMYFGIKKHFEDIADAEIYAAREAYNKKVYELEDHNNSIDGSLTGPSNIDVKSKVNALNNKPDILTDYTKYFNSKGEKLDITESLRDAKEAADKEGFTEEELAEMESPKDDEPYTDEEDEEESIKYEDHKLNGNHKAAIADNKDPYEIDTGDYELTCSNYEKIGLNWYVYDEVLANESEEMVDTDLFVGSVLSDSGFDYDERDVIFVRNDKMMCDFEIKKIYGPFGRNE